MTREEELAALRAKLGKRRDRPGYAENVKALEARIAELEAQE
jgi:phosphopentomutase